jgi:chorismate mutase-like protein
VSAPDRPVLEDAEDAIERLRANIDQVDEVLLKLLNQRAKWALEIGDVKQRAGLAIYQPDREALVLEHVLTINRGPLRSDAIRRLFERIIDENRRLERIAKEYAE